MVENYILLTVSLKLILHMRDCLAHQCLMEDLK